MLEVYTVTEIAEIMKVNRASVLLWIIKLKLPAAKLGGQYRVEKVDFDRFVEKRKLEGGK